MDLSALIFVALAVAWAVYLIPRALRQHEEATSSRPVESFSHRMRVLARREPVDRKNARLVVTPGAPAPVIEADPLPVSLTPAQRRARALRARAAARRRRRVLVTLLALVVVAVGLAAPGVTPWWSVAVPAALVVAWLVLCRLMVTRERAAAPARPRSTGDDAPALAAPAGGAGRAEDADDAEQAGDEDLPGDDTQEFAAIVVDEDDEDDEPAARTDPPAEASAPTGATAGWDPVPSTLPTYTQKPAAPRRTVRTIDLDSTGVWTSGRTEADSALAREAEAAEAADRAARTSAEKDGKRASGS